MPFAVPPRLFSHTLGRKPTWGDGDGSEDLDTDGGGKAALSAETVSSSVKCAFWVPFFWGGCPRAMIFLWKKHLFFQGQGMEVSTSGPAV